MYDYTGRQNKNFFALSSIKLFLIDFFSADYKFGHENGVSRFLINLKSKLLK